MRERIDTVVSAVLEGWLWKHLYQEALKIGLVNDQIHTIVISGGTGVGKSYVLRQLPREMANSISF